MKVALWKPVVGYEFLYEVSNMGNVRNSKTGRVLKHNVLRDGYIQIRLYKDKIPKPYLLHRLVALAWIPNPDNLETVNHKDGIKANCGEANLEWATRSDNQHHAYSTGLQVPKTRDQVSSSKLSSNDVSLIREVYIPHSRDFGGAALARKFGVSTQLIHRVLGDNK